MLTCTSHKQSFLQHWSTVGRVRESVFTLGCARHSPFVLDVSCLTEWWTPEVPIVITCNCHISLAFTRMTFDLDSFKDGCRKMSLYLCLLCRMSRFSLCILGGNIISVKCGQFSVISAGGVGLPFLLSLKRLPSMLSLSALPICIQYFVRETLELWVATMS